MNLAPVAAARSDKVEKPETSKGRPEDDVTESLEEEEKLAMVCRVGRLEEASVAMSIVTSSRTAALQTAAMIVAERLRAGYEVAETWAHAGRRHEGQVNR